MKCEKHVYASRRQARSARKHIGDPTLRPYRCPDCYGNPWHLGHLALRIRAGVDGRQEVYGKDDGEALATRG